MAGMKTPADLLHIWCRGGLQRLRTHVCLRGEQSMWNPRRWSTNVKPLG